MLSRVGMLVWVGLLSQFAVGCATSRGEIEAWRATAVAGAPSGPHGDVASALALRREQRLEEARSLALRLVAERPDDPDALLVASVCESDALVTLPEDAASERELAAWSALDFAERAVLARATPSADAYAQLARSLGATIHLRSMFARADAAWQTADAVEAALAVDPDHADALATRATLRLRLSTLPAIARFFAGDVPKASIESALADAEAAVAARPSVENVLLLAKVYDAAGGADEAMAARERARTSADVYPRDAALRGR